MEEGRLEPPPGLAIPATAAPAVASGAVDDAAHAAVAKNPLDIFDQPMKVQACAATPCEAGKQATDLKPELALPQKVFEQQEQQALADDIARLQYENAMLRQQAQAVHQAQMSPMNGMSPMNSWWPDDPWAAAEAAEVGLQPGVTVTLVALKNASELNGVKAVVQYWHAESGRWAVRLPDGEEKFVKIENLQVTEGPAGYYPCYYMDMPYGCPWYPSGEMPGKRNRARTNSGKSNGGGAGKRGRETSSFGSDVSTTFGSSPSDSSFSDNGVEVDDKKNGDPKPAEQSTTIMMRNIPNNYTREMLLDLLKDHGFDKSYDLIYLPIDFQTEVGIGYAFINLVSEDEVEKFREHFHGFTDWKVASQKVCEVSWSNPLQGIQSHIDRYRNSPVMHESVPDEYKPMLFKDGKRIPFPAPTKRIRAPRLRRPGSK
mmetsp:Transcript_29449/g.51650  ORF Transcript_29449/g.51650 Transcript_29449/m.51650 type:complete len:429 (-) Transcript_29449:95-1381(-)